MNTYSYAKGYVAKITDDIMSINESHYITSKSAIPKQYIKDPISITVNGLNLRYHHKYKHVIDDIVNNFTIKNTKFVELNNCLIPPNNSYTLTFDNNITALDDKHIYEIWYNKSRINITCDSHIKCDDHLKNEITGIKNGKLISIIYCKYCSRDYDVNFAYSLCYTTGIKLYNKKHKYKYCILLHEVNICKYRSAIQITDNKNYTLILLNELVPIKTKLYLFYFSGTYNGAIFDMSFTHNNYSIAFYKVFGEELTIEKDINLWGLNIKLRLTKNTLNITTDNIIEILSFIIDKDAKIL